ncbi:50S ribosomal protein L19 [Candidatus Peregrinibacteria bacterium]|nr:50S ribosomal protein L19 [Candidatus Peregrinibacteria bacterium]
MHQLIEEIQKISLKKKIPELAPGMTVRVSQKIKEGDKERLQAFEGVVISVGSGSGVDKNFTVRKIVDGIGVEKTFPFHSPIVAKIEIKKTGKIRRAKLYYMRNLQGKAARLKEKGLRETPEEEKEKAVAELAEQKAKEEAVKAKAETAGAATQ